MEPQLRQIAYIVSIKDLLKGKFIKEDGWNPNYVVIGSKKVSRINIIGAIIDVRDDNNFQNIIIDDGTGKISIRNFEKKINVNSGDAVLLVGRVREYGSERYITPEIIKKSVNAKWSSVWRKKALIGEYTEEVEEEELEEIEIQKPKSYIEKILGKIKDLDDGSGVPYEEIMKTFNDEKIISELLLQGDVFEVKPGRLKVLD